YHIHKALLVHHSEYFRKALTGPSKGAQEGVVNLEDVEPDKFVLVNIFVHWLYTQSLPPCTEWDRMVDTVNDRSLLKMKAYAFADRFLVPELRRMVNNSFVAFTDLGCAAALLCYTQEAYATIPVDRPILQLLVDAHCERWTPCVEVHLPNMLAEYPHAFVVRALRRMHEKLLRTMRGLPEKWPRCYYEHASEEEKYTCRVWHREYDHEKGYGFFGTRYTCVTCAEDGA
ncbi:hypothetical protein BDW02DRAFT_620594, partial [Decorospora gaudefroyi]